MGPSERRLGRADVLIMSAEQHAQNAAKTMPYGPIDPAVAGGFAAFLEMRFDTERADLFDNELVAQRPADAFEATLALVISSGAMYTADVLGDSALATAAIAEGVIAALRYVEYRKYVEEAANDGDR